MANFKLSEDDESFLRIPDDAVLVFAGASGTETWIERDADVTVRIVAKAVGFATADDGAIQVRIEIGDACAKGQDGPAPIETQLRASQSVQVVVKAGERLAFKAYPVATNAKVLRTVVCTADWRPSPAASGPATASQGQATNAGGSARENGSAGRSAVEQRPA